MADLTHFWGNDLAVSDTPAVTQQRVLRRLLTNPGEYLWSLDYGAGLASFVGQPGTVLTVQAAVRGQIFKEAAVAQSPPPVIDVVPDPSGTLYAHIRYADAVTGTTQTVAVAA